MVSWSMFDGRRVEGCGKPGIRPRWEKYWGEVVRVGEGAEAGERGGWLVD